LDARLQPWLASTLSGLNAGVRRDNSENIIAFFNLQTQGVLSTSRMHFMLQQVTSLCHAHSRSLICVIIMPNRAGDARSGTGHVKILSQIMPN